MKSKLIISAVGVILLASCSKTDLYDSEVAQKAADQANADKVFGVQFSPDQDWCTTVNGKVYVKADPSVKKVQLLVYAEEAYEDWTNPDVTSHKVLKTINQAELQGSTDITLYYDAPEKNYGLYVAFITKDNGYFLSKVENGTASMNNARTRGDVLTSGYTLPETPNVHVAGSTPSFASQPAQGWNPDEKLYYLDNYAALQPTNSPGDYSTDFKAFFKQYLDTYLPNGRQNDNSFRVSNDDAYNNSVYYSSVKDEPIILTPVYKYDHPTLYGFEVYRSDLYYYYYKDSEVTGDFTAFIKSLPKYKAIPFNQVFGEEEDAQVQRHTSYALPFFKTGSSTVVADANTECTFKWPEGYKIGFMIQAWTTADGGRKQGEVYADGRLNNNINNWGNFATSGFNKLGTDYPRALWLSFNNKVFISWESGTDRDFNDVVIEVVGGTVIPPIPEPDLEWFTYCFEDTKEGDYDMNDLVIKATRIDETTVEYRIVACGAYDDISAMGINSGDIQDGAEVHDLFNVSNHKTFINTDGSDYGYISATKTVDENFSFLTTKQQPYLKDLTTGNEVHLAGAGQNPHGILVPTNFRYPTEKTCITDSYPEFIKWARDNDPDSQLWYKSPVLSRVR